MCSTTTSHGTAVIEHIEQTDSVHTVTYRTEYDALRCVASRRRAASGNNEP